MATNKTDNFMFKYGARALSKALKVNTTLETLDLSCEHQQANVKQGHTNINNKAVNNMGAEGACALGEALKANAALETLDLERLQQQYQGKQGHQQQQSRQ